MKLDRCTILLTNDDGYRSPGLRALAERLERDHDVWVVAPDDERSACSHGISTGGGPLVTEQIEERVYSCSGLTVDCVNLALSGLLPRRPDLVISGINLGPNVGTDVIFSGTAAGARHAALEGIPGVALSIFAYHAPFHFGPVIAFVAANVDTILTSLTPGEFLNFNFPNLPEAVRLKNMPLGRTVYRDTRTHHDAPNGKRYHFWAGDLDRDSAEGDLAAVLEGHTAVTRIRVMPAEGASVDVGDFRQS